MNKLFFIFLIIINAINKNNCLGITNFVIIDRTYVINIASEDVPAFEQKLENRLANIKNEFNLIIAKILLISLVPYFLFMIYKFFIRKIIFKFNFILFSIILIFDLAYIIHFWNDYKYGIISAQNAIISLDITKNQNYQIDPSKSNYKNKKYKINYIGDEIKKYGIHAIFCEIPGTLPSNNANPESYSSSFGGFCFNYNSQRRYLDPEAYDYIGEKESQKYRKIQLNKSFDLF